MHPKSSRSGGETARAAFAPTGSPSGPKEGVEHGIEPVRPETWTAGPVRRLQALRRKDAFALMASDQVRSGLDDLLSAGCWRPPKAWGLPMVTLPEVDATWSVPSSGWHVDSYGPEHDLPGVTVFVFLAPATEGGGGTAVLAGSHRLVNRHIATTGTWRPADVRAALATTYPWLDDVWRGRRETGRPRAEHRPDAPDDVG